MTWSLKKQQAAKHSSSFMLPEIRLAIKTVVQSIKSTNATRSRVHDDEARRTAFVFRLRTCQQVKDGDASPNWVHPIFFGEVIAALHFLQSMISGLRLFSKPHSQSAGRWLRTSTSGHHV